MSRVSEGNMLAFSQMYERIVGKSFSGDFDVLAGRSSFKDALRMNFIMLEQELAEAKKRVEELARQLNLIEQDQEGGR